MVRISSIPLWHRLITVNKKGLPISQPKPEPDNGAQPFRMQQKFLDWKLRFIRLRSATNKNLTAEALCKHSVHTVTPSPSMSTRAGKDILTQYPNHQGSLGTAISEAIELARTTPNCKYTLGSVLSHVTLHQTVIGLEAEKQMEMAGEYPDIVIGCFGGGSNFGGICFPFMRHSILEGKQTRYIAAEPASCPKLTRGKFEYDYGDEAGYTPLLPMYTLGHNFAPANIHAGGLRYHGAGVIVSQLLKDNLMEAVDIQQLESFDAGILFAKAEGIIPAPESCHAIAAAIREADKCKESGEEKVILFNLSGHGLIDMSAYDQYLSGNLTNYSLSDDEIEKNLKEVEEKLQ